MSDDGKISQAPNIGGSRLDIASRM